MLSLITDNDNLSLNFFCDFFPTLITIDKFSVFVCLPIGHKHFAVVSIPRHTYVTSTMLADGVVVA